MDRRIGFCREAARSVVRCHGVRRPPVNVHAIATAQGYDVRERDLGRLDARARKIEGHWVIDVNPNYALTAQRFSVAHEIGHIVLGHEHGAGDVAERQANVFAAELLMPLPMLKSALKQTKGLGDLARLFQVSRDAMRIKLDAQHLLMQLESFD